MGQWLRSLSEPLAEETEASSEKASAWPEKEKGE
jgi:hypothetical protein